MEMHKAEPHPIRRYFNFYSLAVNKLLSCMYNISLNLVGKRIGFVTRVLNLNSNLQPKLQK